MKHEYKVKQVTRLYESCNKCGLPIINCICDIVPEIKTESKIWILSTEREFRRPSNTARILKLINPQSTELILWERKEAPKKLIEYINSGKYEIRLLFPTEDDDKSNLKRDNESNGREVEKDRLEENIETENCEKIKAFIILDGTWKEAAKMFRKSEYLKELPRVSLNPVNKSEYSLRRGAGEGELCTIEAAIEMLKLNGEYHCASVIKETFELFIKSFKAGANGVKYKIEKAD